MDKPVKKQRFDFVVMKAGATSDNSKTRKKAFEQYFEQFGEFPSYLFDNEHEIDQRLAETIEQLKSDPATPSNMRKAIELMIERLPHHPQFS